MDFLFQTGLIWVILFVLGVVFMFWSAGSNGGGSSSDYVFPNDPSTNELQSAVYSVTKDGNIRIDVPERGVAFTVAAYGGDEPHSQVSYITQRIDPSSGRPAEKYVWHSPDSWRFGSNPAEETVKHLESEIRRYPKKKK